MRPAHALLALVTLTGLVVAGLFFFGPERERQNDVGVASAGREDSDGAFVIDPRTMVREARSARLAAESPPPEPVVGEPAPSAGAKARADAITGHIVGAPPGRLAGLEVQATALDAREPARGAPCDAQGRFTLPGLRPEKTYHLRVVPVGRASYARSRTEVRTARPGAGEVELQWVPDPALVFQVADARTGSALTHFEVRLGRGFARPLLDEEGRIRRSFPEGRVRWVGWVPEETREPVELVVSARGYRELSVGALVAPRYDDLDLGRLVLEPVPRLIVRVLDEATQLPVEGALVSLRHAAGASVPSSAQAFDPHAGRTDAQGLVTLTCFPGEDATLAVQHAEHADYERPFALSLAEEQQETVRLAPRR